MMNYSTLFEATNGALSIRVFQNAKDLTKANIVMRDLNDDVLLEKRGITANEALALAFEQLDADLHGHDTYVFTS